MHKEVSSFTEHFTSFEPAINKFHWCKRFNAELERHSAPIAMADTDVLVSIVNMLYLKLACSRLILCAGNSRVVYP